MTIENGPGMPTVTKSAFEDIIRVSNLLVAPEPLKLLPLAKGEDMAKPEPAALRRRKKKLVEIYSDPIRMVVAFKLIYERGDTGLTKRGLDEHAKNIVLLVLRQVDVGSHWPPDAKMDAEVDRILDEYLNALMAQR
jgi:hypothetical protein